MAKHSLLVFALVFAVFTGYVLGQRGVKPLPRSPIFSGDDLAFQVDLPSQHQLTNPNLDEVTGRFLVKVEGRWVEARPAARAGVVPVK